MNEPLQMVIHWVSKGKYHVYIKVRGREREGGEARQCILVHTEALAARGCHNIFLAGRDRLLSWRASILYTDASFLGFSMSTNKVSAQQLPRLQLNPGLRALGFTDSDLCVNSRAQGSKSKTMLNSASSLPLTEAKLVQ